jgi:hypothetical protein
MLLLNVDISDRDAYPRAPDVRQSATSYRLGEAEVG